MANYTLGTVLAAADFDVESTCASLKKAVQGFSADNASIIEALCRLSSGQRQEVVRHFKSAYGEDLYSLMRTELSGHLRTVVLCLLTPVRELEALCLLKAGADRVGTLEDVLIELVSSRSKRELEEIKAVYLDVSGGVELDKHIVSETSGDLQRVLRALLAGGREDDGAEDEELAAKDAEVLYKAGEARFGTNEAKFTRLLCTRSLPQLRATFRAYQRLYGKDILAVINEETSGHLRKTYYAIALCAVNRPRYFAELFKQSMEGLGTNDSLLIRLVVTRCEIDLVEIKQEFAALYGKTLVEWIKDDTSGNYRNILVRLTEGQHAN